MKNVIYISGILSIMLAGCATPMPPQEVKVVGNTFCKTMKRIHPPNGKVKWAPAGVPETVDAVRRQNRAVDQKC